MNDIEKRVKSYEPVFGVYEAIPSADGDGLYSLGEGSFGQVFAFRHIRNAHHFIALKVISIPKDKNDENYIRLNSGGNTDGMAKSIDAYVDRYAKEIDILKSLDDVATVVKYKDFDIRDHSNGTGKDILISMELLTSLDTILLNDTYDYRITVNDIIHLGIDMCDALVNLQKYNIVHRDIKPSNIFVSPKGLFKLGDFGTAKISMNRETSSERGTPIYAAPEIIKRDKIDAGDTRCDIYSLGVVLYMLLNENMPPFITKESRFGADNEALSRRLNGESLPLPTRAEEHKRLAEIIMKACQYNPKERYDSAVQMKADLEAVCDNQAIQFIPKPYEFETNLSTAVITVPSASVQAEPKESEKKDRDEEKTVVVDNNISTDTGKKRISKRIKVSLAVAIAIVLSVVGYTLWRFMPGDDIPSDSVVIDDTATVDGMMQDSEIEPLDAETLAGSILTEESDDNFEYASANKQVTITKYTGNEMRIVIPSEINGLPVTAIGKEAFRNYKNLVNVTIPESIVSIGESAFRDCENLVTITISNGVTSVGDSAFRDCKELMRITIPDSVTSIGDSTFRDCTSLQKITIPDSVTSIGDSAFWFCSSLHTFNIPNSVTSIGYEALTGCTSLTGINVDSDNVAFTSDDGVLFNKDKTTLMIYPSAKRGSAYVIPKSVREIEERTFFRCANLTDIKVADDNTAFSSYNGVLFNKAGTKLVRYPIAKSDNSYAVPEGVTAIEKFAFEDSNLTSITLPDSVATIGKGAFELCERLKSIEIPDKVTAIESDTFRYCSRLTNITLSKTASIHSYAFVGCENLKEITIPASVTYISDNAFANCKRLSAAYFEHTKAGSITKFGDDVFGNVSANFKIVLRKDATGFTTPKWKGYPTEFDTVSPASNFEYIADNDNVRIMKYTGNETDAAIPSQINGLPVIEIGEKAFEGNKTLASVTIPDSVTAIGEGAFRNCEKLKTVKLSDHLTSIGNWAFWYCVNLGEIAIPQSVTTIGWEAFAGCTGLTALNVDGGNAVYSSDGGVLFDKAKTKIIQYPGAKSGSSYVIPASVTEIEGRAFFGSKNLKTVTIPSSVTVIGYNAFEFCANLTAINVDGGNTVYSSDNGILFSKTKTKLIRYPSAKSESSYTVPSSVTSIGNDVFANCENLTTITIPDSVTSIGESTLRGCKNLNAVYFGENMPNIVDINGDKSGKLQGVSENALITSNNQTITGNLLYDKFLINKFAEMRDISSEPNTITRYSLMDFRLIDFDNNGVPDLWYAGKLDVEPAWLYIPVGFCTIIDGEVVELLTGGHYWEGADDIMSAYNTEIKKHVIGTRKGYIGSVFTWYTMDNGKLTKIDEFYDEPENEAKEIKKYIEPIENQYILPSYEEVKAMFHQETGR